MENRKVYIYTLTDPKDGSVKYIGKTFRLGRRLRDHLYEAKKSNTPKNAWINKLLREGRKPILDIIDECYIKESNDLEIYWISQFKTWGFELKNYTNGGEGSYGVEPWNKGLKGVFNHSDDSKKKMSEKRKGLLKGENNGFYGKKHSKENIELFKKLSSERKWSDDMMNKMSGINSKCIKKVFCYDLQGNLVKKYDYGKQTEEDGFNSNMVSKVCRGIRKTHKSHIFSFELIHNFNPDDYKKNIWKGGSKKKE